MRRLTLPIRKCIENNIWIPALTTVLTIPDICAWLENPAAKTGERYKDWCQKWIEPRYSYIRPVKNPKHSADADPNGFFATSREPPLIFEQRVLLSATDLYALRCAITHSGSVDISTQRARKTLDRFEFTTPDSRNVSAHCNLKNTGQMQLEIDKFCYDICDAADEWDSSTLDDEIVQSNKKELVAFRHIDTLNDLLGIQINNQ